MKLDQFAATVSLFAHAALSLGVQQHCPQGQICLTSFRRCDNHYDEGCGEPPDSYSRTASDDSVRLPALLGDTNYTISWVFGPDGHADIPVRIQWLMDTIVWETSKHPIMTSNHNMPVFTVINTQIRPCSSIFSNQGRSLPLSQQH